MLLSGCAVGEIGGSSGGPLSPSTQLEVPRPDDPAPLSECPGAYPDISTKSGWQSSDAALPASGTLRFEVKARPGAAKLDALLAIGAETIDEFDKAAITVRFAENGLVDVRDGAFYVSDVAFPYEADVWYSIGVSADIDEKTYDVEIGPCGEARQTLVQKASFRDGSRVLGWLRAWAIWASQSAGLEVSTPAWMPSGGCVPSTCETLGQACGQPSDGCGGSLNCGGCQSGELCESGACVPQPVMVIPPPVCEPATCELLGKECGFESDRCDGFLNCGGCASGETCTAGTCVAEPLTPPSCVPDTCQSLARQCGTTADGCGGLLNCGGCSSDQSCTSGVCIDDPVTPPPPPVCVPESCQSLGVECGGAGDGCGGTLSCGGCGSNASCSAGICVANPVTPPPSGDPDRPWAHNTGPSNPGALVKRGALTISSPGVYENLDITGDIYITSSNVTVRNFRVNASGNQRGVWITPGLRNIVLEDGEVYGMSSIGIYGMGYTARRLHIHDSGGDALRPEGNPGAGPTLVEYCFIERMGLSSSAHADALQVSNVSEGSYNVTLRYNNLYMPAPGTPEHPGDTSKASAVVFLEKPVSNYLIHDNWMNGGGYTIYCGNNTGGVTWRDNIFGDDYDYGAITGTCQNFTGNVWEDTGTPVSN
jgi:hypothetical protein